MPQSEYLMAVQELLYIRLPLGYVQALCTLPARLQQVTSIHGISLNLLDDSLAALFQ